MSEPKAYSFGYGSLVNRDTHIFRDLYKARVRGWRRRWCHWVEAPFGTCTSLTVVSDASAEVTGLVMGTPLSEHAKLNAREKGYDRIIIPSGAIDHDGPRNIEVELYQSRHQLPGNADAPILQSYLDTVMQGFEAEFGQDGVTDFLANTDGWETPILRDRSNPKYPRVTPLSAIDAERYDAMMSEMDVSYIDPR